MSPLLTNAGYRCFSLSTFRDPESPEKKVGSFFNKLKTVRNFAFACFVYRQLAINALLYTIHMKPFSLGNLRRFLILLVRLRFMRSLMKGSYDLIILDQGLIQYIWSIAVTHQQPNNDKYLARVLKSILDEISLFVIMVDVETELAIERITRRPTNRSRFDRMSPSQAETMLSRHKDMFAQIVEAADKFRKTGYLNVNGNQPIKINVEIIIPFIERARQAHSA
jgi:hypothetical protein